MGIRFNLILEQRQYAYLTTEAERLSVSAGELIRRAVDATYGLHGDARADGFEVSFGVWRKPDAAVVGRRPGVRFRR